MEDRPRFGLSGLDENDLGEPSGISLPGTVTDIYGTYHFCELNNMQPDTDVRKVDWNCDGDDTDVGVSHNINQGMSWNNNSSLDTLTSQNDWSKLVYNGGAIGLGAIVRMPNQSEVIDIDIQEDAQLPPILPPYSLYLPILSR